MFQIEQTYDLAALTVLCRTARKTVRRWTIVFRGALWTIFALGILLSVILLLLGGRPEPWSFAVFAALLALLLLEDRLNAWVAQRQMLPGSAHSVTVFTPDAYTVTTDTTETVYRYENITSLCETADYFIFFLGKKHGQVFNKQGFQQGTPDGFRTSVEEKTGLQFKMIK